MTEWRQHPVVLRNARRETSPLREAGHQLRSSLFESSSLSLKPVQFAVDAVQFSLRFAVFQIVAPTLFLDHRLDLAPEQSQVGISVHRVNVVAELSGPYCLDDLVLREPELLA